MAMHHEGVPRGGDGGPRRIRHGAWLQPLLLILLAGGAVAWLARDHLAKLVKPGDAAHASAAVPTRSAPPPVAVTAASIVEQPVRRQVELVGNLQGLEETSIGAKVEGRVLRIWKDVGDRVKPGDVLLELDPADFELAVAECRRGLELELAKLDLRQMPAGRLDVEHLPGVVRATANEKNVRLRLDRAKQLAMVHGVAEEQLQQEETALAVAVQEVVQAKIEAEATLAGARARAATLDTALKKLADTKIVVPENHAAWPSRLPRDKLGPAYAVTYVVAQRSAAEGEMVRTSSGPMFRLVIDRPLKIDAQAPERHRGELAVGQPAEIRSEAFPGRAFAGVVGRIGPTTDRQSRTFLVEVLVDNADGLLGSGGFAKLAVVTDERAKTLLVPEEAVVSFAGVNKVFAFDPATSTVRGTPVEVGVEMIRKEAGERRGWLEVKGDVHAGMQVVVSGQSQLTDGARVRVKEDAAPPAVGDARLANIEPVKPNPGDKQTADRRPAEDRR